MAVDFKKREPWSAIQTVTIDGQEMVRIPKFYLKVGKNAAEKKCWWVSPKPRNGYHLHPAFMHKGEELDQFYFGAYEAYNAGDGMAGSANGKTPWNGLTFDRAVTACDARNKQDGSQAGWHLENFYERSAISLLCMIEIGSPDAQTKIGAGNSTTTAVVACGSTNATWRGIHEYWGNGREWTDGLMSLNDGLSLLIHDNKGYENFINTGVKVPSVDNLGINEMQDARGDGYDFNDLFVPKAAAGAASASFFKDGAWSTTSGARRLLCGGSYADKDSDGLFTWHFSNLSENTGANVGFRLCKW